MKPLKCRSKNPANCPYHGAAMRAETAYKAGDFDGYAKAREEFEEAGRKLNSPLQKLFSGEEPVEIVNPFRFNATFDLKSAENSIPEINKNITVSAATREEAMDKLVDTVTGYMAKLKADNPSVDFSQEGYSIEVSVPALDSRDDEGYQSSGSYNASLDHALWSVAFIRQSEVNNFNRKVLYPKISNGTATTVEREYFEMSDSRESSSISNVERMLAFKAVGRVVPETAKARANRQATDDRVRELMRQRNVSQTQERRKNEAKVREQEEAMLNQILNNPGN